MARHDPHRPSVINPDDYSYVGVFYQGASEEEHEAYARDIDELIEAAGFDDWSEIPFFEGGNFAAKHSCDHCGARFAHGVVYRHVPSGDFIAIGHICASGLDLALDEASRARRNAERAAKAAKARNVNAAYRAEVLEANPGLAEAFDADHGIVEDIRSRFYSASPMISDKQIALVFKLAAEAKVRAAERAAFEENAVPVIEGKGVEIVGKILAIKDQDGYYGSVLKMLVLDDRQFKVWGSVPSGLSVEIPLDADDIAVNEERVAKGWDPIPAQRRGVQVGERISFVANVERSADDESFGFFKRPRKAKVLNPHPAEEAA